MSFLFDRFKAEVILYESPQLYIKPNTRDVTLFESIDALVEYRKQYGYYGGIRIIEAVIVRLKEYCDECAIKLPKRNFTIEYRSDVPFGVGLGGSSTIIKAVLSALMKFYSLTEREIPKPIQAKLILEAETRELAISAGPQDRVVAVYGGLVYMDFSPEAYKANKGLYGNYFNMDPSLLPPLFIAYKEALSKSSGEIHNIMRYRVSVEHDQRVVDAMKAKAHLVDEARECLMKGQKDKLGPIMSRDFELRKSVYSLSEENIRMIEIAKKMDAHAKFTGSGGAAVGTYESEEHFDRIDKEYHRHGYDTVKAHPVEYGES
jgi:glucuronokinase